MNPRCIDALVHRCRPNSIVAAFDLDSLRNLKEVFFCSSNLVHCKLHTVFITRNSPPWRRTFASEFTAATFRYFCGKKIKVFNIAYKKNNLIASNLYVCIDFLKVKQKWQNKKFTHILAVHFGKISVVF